MMEKLEEMKIKSEEIKKIKETLVSWLRDEVNTGATCCHLESAGDVTDMIKDLAEAEKECAEALYYTIVSEAMLKGEEPSYGDAMGYNHRHMSNGRFASSGKGHMVYGYHKPYLDQQPYIDGYLHDPNFRSTMEHAENMGYNGERMMGDHQGRSSKYGKSYDDYQEARRHYTVSKDSRYKDEMDHHAMSHVDNTLESLQEMWESSDDAMLKKRIVDEMSKVLSQLKGSLPK